MEAACLVVFGILGRIAKPGDRKTVESARLWMVDCYRRVGGAGADADNLGDRLAQMIADPGMKPGLPAGGNETRPPKEKPVIEPTTIPSLATLQVAPAWAAMMSKDHFIVHANSSAILCKGWKQMAQAMHAQPPDSWTLQVMSRLLDRDAWNSDDEGLPFSCCGKVYRITQHWGAA
jgi:hypothetical protein